MMPLYGAKTSTASAARGITLFVLSTISEKAEEAGALLLFAARTAVSMALLSSVFSLAIARGPVGHNLERSCGERPSSFPAYGICGWTRATEERTKAQTGCARLWGGAWIS